MKIGFIGLGNMGKPMAVNLLHAGYKLNVYERNNESVTLGKMGSKVYKDCESIARDSDLIITILPDSPEVLDVLNRDDGLLKGLREGSVYIDMSTISPSVSVDIYNRLRDKRVFALDAPVSGGDIGAKLGELSIMVGGDEEIFNKVLPIFKILGSNIVYMGGSGSGQMTKACNQIIVALNILGVSEAFNLARDAELDLKRLREALLGGFAQSRVLDLHGQRIIDENFEAGFRVNLHRKDLNIILNEGYLRSLPLLGTGVIANLMDSMISTGKGSLDHSAVFSFLKTLSKNL